MLISVLAYNEVASLQLPTETFGPHLHNICSAPSVRELLAILALVGSKIKDIDLMIFMQLSAWKATLCQSAYKS